MIDDSIMQRPDDENDEVTTNFVSELRNNLSDIAATVSIIHITNNNYYYYVYFDNNNLNRYLHVYLMQYY